MSTEKKEVLVVDYKNQLVGMDKSFSDMIKDIFQSKDAELSQVAIKAAKVRDMEMSPEKCKAASAVRKEYKAIRCKIESERKEAKAPFTLAGKAVDGVSNLYKLYISPFEKEFTELEIYRVPRRICKGFFGNSGTPGY